MKEIFVLNKEKNFEISRNYINKPLFYGYWNSLNPDFGGYELLDDINKISFNDIQDLILKLDLNEFDYLGSHNVHMLYLSIHMITLLSQDLPQFNSL